MNRRRFIVLGLAIVAATAGACRAGMPSYTAADLPRVRSLADLARMRLEVISFFLVALLAFTAVLRAIWNGLRKDFPRLPRLSYIRALGVVALWGLLFLLVLSMISGARELMTPGAWEKVGATYRLAPDAPPIEAEITRRFDAIDRLAGALLERRSAGQFPRRESIDDALWIVPGTEGARYVYLGGAAFAADNDLREDPSLPNLLAVEPPAVGAVRLAILRGGEIRWVTEFEVEALSKPEAP